MNAKSFLSKQTVNSNLADRINKRNCWITMAIALKVFSLRKFWQMTSMLIIRTARGLTTVTDLFRTSQSVKRLFCMKFCLHLFWQHMRSLVVEALKQYKFSRVWRLLYCVNHWRYWYCENHQNYQYKNITDSYTIMDHTLNTAWFL